MNSRSDAPAGGGGGVTRIVRQWASDSVRHTPTDGGGWHYVSPLIPLMRRIRKPSLSLWPSCLYSTPNPTPNPPSNFSPIRFYC